MLEYIHSKGVIHRDIKPENVILDEKNHLKLIDFGTADVEELPGVNDDLYKEYLEIRQKYDAPRNTMEWNDFQSKKKSFVGTVYYVAPEMLENQNVDFGCDYWALGIIIHRLLTGQYLFNDQNEYLTFEKIKRCEFQIPEDFDPDARDLVSKLIRLESKERIGNGPADRGLDLAALKAHKFFTGINFDTLQTDPSPLASTSSKDEKTYQSSMSRDSEFLVTADEVFGKKTDNKVLILTGRVKKFKMKIFYNTRQLILYSNGDLQYLDPTSNEVKGLIPLRKTTKVYIKEKDVFHIENPERTFIFFSEDVPATSWVEKINQVIERNFS